METIDEKIEINKELTKKDIAAILATMIGQLSAISANATPGTSMYTAHIDRALQEVKKAEQTFKMTAPKYKDGVEFKINEEQSEKCKSFTEWLLKSPYNRQIKYHDFDEIWPCEIDGDLVLCMSPINEKDMVDNRILSWNTKTGKSEVHPEKSIPKEMVDDGVSLMSRVWRSYKGKKTFNY